MGGRLATMYMLAALAYEGRSAAINIGTGIETDVVALYDGISAALGLSVTVRHGPAKNGEQQRSVLDCSRAKEVLNWLPEVSMLEGLRSTVRWFSSNWSP